MALEASASASSTHASVADTTAAPASNVGATVAASIDTVAGCNGTAASANPHQRKVRALEPGFRFHPTDQELVNYYLKRKICRKPFRFDVIANVDIYKNDPWELPAKSLIKSQDHEWYFFSALNHKGKNKSATGRGYWNLTGKNWAAKHNHRVVGLRRILVFYYGRGPDKKRTNWVMYEYRLVEEEMDKCGIGKDPYVLCKVFHKSKIGRPFGTQYAPIVEDKWDNDDAVLPGEVAGEQTATAEASENEQELPSSEAAADLDTEPPNTDPLTKTSLPR